MDKHAYKELIATLMREESIIKDELSAALQELGEIYSAVDNEPNNMKLGKKVRQLIWENTENE
tara:strand:+ start:65 stop:253 length:189 start_codon:yes stop_codon:yes gene_type:complete